jgi:hypothetical protein
MPKKLLALKNDNMILKQQSFIPTLLFTSFVGATTVKSICGF